MVNADDERKKIHFVKCGRFPSLPATSAQKTTAANDNLAAQNVALVANAWEDIVTALGVNARCENAAHGIQSAVASFYRAACSYQRLRAVPATIGRIALVVACVFGAIFGIAMDSES